MDKREFMAGCAAGGARLQRMLAGLVRSFGDKLYRDAQRLVGSAHEAQDVVQEVLIKAWRHCHEFRGDAELSTWLHPILRRSAIDHLRRRRDELPLLDDAGQLLAEVEQALQQAAGDPLRHPPDAARSAQSQRMFEQGLARLRADHPLAALVILLIARDDLSMDELARCLDRSPGATREYVSQCRKKARVYLADWYAMTCEREDQAV